MFTQAAVQEIPLKEPIIEDHYRQTVPDYNFNKNILTFFICLSFFAWENKD